MATHSSILAWKIPWTEKSGRLQSMVSQELDTTEQLHFASELMHIIPLYAFIHTYRYMCFYSHRYTCKQYFLEHSLG